MERAEDTSDIRPVKEGKKSTKRGVLLPVDSRRTAPVLSFYCVSKIYAYMRLEHRNLTGSMLKLLLLINFLYLCVSSFRNISPSTSFGRANVRTGIGRSTKQSCNRCRLLMSSTSSSSIPKDVVIIGGGLAGLSAALHIATSTTKNRREVTVVDAMPKSQDISKSTTGSFAAAGMLAPQSERLLPGPYLDLCLKSRSIYPRFVSQVETLAKDYYTSWCDHEINHLSHNEATLEGATATSMEPWEVGFLATGGFIAPAFAGDSVETWAPPPGGGTARWLDASQVLELEPQLHPSVVGGWWFPEDASVDARRLTCSLRAACVAAGVQLQNGPNYGVSSLDLQGGRCTGVKLNNGKTYTADSILIANGSWMRNLLPVPIVPHKGQSLSLRMNPNQPPLLSRVLFAQDTYIVPKADGRIIVGATVEPGSFDPSVTPAGIMHILTNAIRLVPELASLPMEECWSGLRPTTPDKMPILGKTPWDNLFVAGGYWRNGVLLAPKTGQIIGDVLMNQVLSSEDEELLQAFSWDRFVSKEGGLKMAVTARIAAATYPTQQRAKGFGISPSVGTELGFYSSASSAAEERKRDRDDNDDAALEKAAQLGVSDASLFEYRVPSAVPPSSSIGQSPAAEENSIILNPISKIQKTSFLDAYSVTSSEQRIGDTNEERKIDGINNIGMEGRSMAAIYEQISQNKKNSLQQNDLLMGEPDEKIRPDPGFRIHHVALTTHKMTLIPPYTRPETFFTDKVGAASEGFAANEYNEGTYDGYTEIEKANGSASREEELAAMKRARQENRDIFSEIDISKIGAQRTAEISDESWRKRKESVKDENKDGGDDEEALERAAKLGFSDATMFDYRIQASQPPPAKRLDSVTKVTSATLLDAYQVGNSEPRAVNSDGNVRLDSASNMDAIYEKISLNKKNSLQSEIEMGEPYRVDKDRPDPGFRVHHVELSTQKMTLIPPFSRPEAFLASGKFSEGFAANEYSEETYDGYTEIQKANGSQSREEELAAMKRAREENRDSMSDVDLSKIGAQRMEEKTADDAYQF